MRPTELFVYGTLRHDQPEHAKYCRGVVGWRKARLRGNLWMIPAGYWLGVVPPATVLLKATNDSAADEGRRSALNPAQIAHAGQSNAAGWIAGELLMLRDALEAWPSIDAWEDFAPGKPGCYPRVVVPVEIVDAKTGGPCWIAAWAYVATTVPEGSLELKKGD